MQPNRLSKLKSGYTTGTCAQAATKASGLMLITKRVVKRVDVETPKGINLNLKIFNPKIGRGFAQCAVVKDAGDDPDVTDGARIYARVKYSDKKGIFIRGGKGVGVVTKPGLAVKVGEPAINPVPRKMIMKEASRFLPQDKGLEIIISVPKGEELAKHTFNPRLGITGGISIIGTTGIVEPKSSSAYQASLSLQLDVLKAAGYKEAVLVLGYVGEGFAKGALGFQEDSIIKIGDHIGFMLKECLKKGINKVLLIGHIGKLVKVANGQFNTHSRFGDNRISVITGHAKSCGAKEIVIEELLRQTTAEATIDILRKNGLQRIFDSLARKIVGKINEFSGHKLCIKCVILSLKGEVLGCSPRNCVLSE